MESDHARLACRGRVLLADDNADMREYIQRLRCDQGEPARRRGSTVSVVVPTIGVPDIYQVLLRKAAREPNGLVARSGTELNVPGVLSDGIAHGRRRFSRHDDVAVLRGRVRRSGGKSVMRSVRGPAA